MIKVSHLVKFVQELKPQSTPTRLTFFNYIKNLCDPEERLIPEHIDDFFLAAIDYAHWYSHRSQLGHEVELLLTNFNSYFQNQFPIHLVRFPQTLQIIEIEQNQDWQELVADYLRRICTPHDRSRVMVDSLKRGVGIILRQDESLEVRFFDRKFILCQGQLEPLRKDHVLYYDSNLELSSAHTHKFDLAPQMTVQLEMKNQLATGSIVRGYFFQKLQGFENAALQTVPKLFSQLKKLEQLFITPGTDSYYLDLKSQLETTISQLVVGNPEAKEWATYLLSQAETASREIYTDDKTLERLVRDLRSHLPKEAQENGSQRKITTHSPQQIHGRQRPHEPSPSR